MMKDPMGGFDVLRQNIIASAVKDLEKTAPEYVSAFRKTLQSKGFEQAVAEVKSTQVDSRFNKWREICTRLLDVELAIHQLRNSLTLLKQPNPTPLTMGEWVIYHHDAWAIWAQSLLSRFEKLTVKIIRELIRPQNSNFKSVETEMVSQIRSLKDEVRKVRDPVAHGGGPIEVLKDEGLLEPLLLIGGVVDMKGIFGQMAAFQQKWHKKLYDKSALILAEIYRLSKRLNDKVTWD